MFISLIPYNSEAVNFYSINRLFGISMRETYSVCKDDNGFIWISSKTGILRLTDDNHRIYALPYESTNVLMVELVYQQSELIAYTNNGQIFIYNPVFDRFDLIFNLSKTLNNSFLFLEDVLVDSSGTFWLASSVGLYKFEKPENLTFIREISNSRYSTTWFDSQHILIAKTDGIWLFDTGSLEYKQLYNNSTVTPFIISKLYFDEKENKLLLGTLSNGLFLFDLNTNTLSQKLGSELPEQPVLAIEKNSDSTWLIGIDGQGIWELNKNCNKVINVYKKDSDNPFSLIGNGVYDIYCDEFKRVWVCTYSGGASYYNLTSSLVTHILHQSDNPNSLVNNDVNSIIEDSWGKFWFATNNGISCWDPDSENWKSYYADAQDRSQVFLTLCEDNHGRIWAGTYSSGVYVLDSRTGRELKHYSQNSRNGETVSNYIFKIYKDSQGDIWLGSNVDEIMYYNFETDRFRAYTRDPVSSIKEITPNLIAFGCSYGLYLLNKQTGESNRVLLDVTVTDIWVQGDIIWICTRGSGLIRYNYKNEATEKFTVESGLPSDYLNSILYVNGLIWLGTENGLCSFNPQDGIVNTFPSFFSLSSASYNNSSPFVTSNGQLAWGTNDGAVLFFPDSLKNEPLTGRIFYQDIIISGLSVRDIPSFNLDMPVDNIQSIELHHNRNNLNIELLPLSTTRNAKFSWKLEGFDSDWSAPTDNRTINYTYIPSGKYQLKIKLYNSSLSQVIAERTVSVKSIPPFWKTIWFIVLVALAVVGLIIFYFINYTSRLKRIHTEEKIRFFTNTSHDFKTSLSLIKGPIEELTKEANISKAGKNYLGLAIEQVRQLSFVANQLLEFQKADLGKEILSHSMVDIVEFISNRKFIYDSLAKDKEIELVFESNRKNYLTAIDEIKMEKVIDNLISNAIKYSHPRSKVIIDLSCHENKWTLRITDHGIGINKNAQKKLFKEFYRSDNAINSKIVGTGIGLLLVKNYVTLHGGTINFSSRENVGSVFQIIIPFKTISKNITTPEKIPVTVAEENNQHESEIPLAENSVITTKEMKVLIVENNEDLLRFMQNVMSNNFQTYTAVDGQNAWESIPKIMPDLVISDVLMPRMDGFELCKLMKSTYETSHIPIILLTSLTGKNEQLHGLGLGADDYVTKPFDISLLVQKIRTIIQNREKIKEKAYRLLNDTSPEPILSNELNDQFIKKMVDVVKVNIANSEFNKNDFANALNVSPSLLYIKVKSLTNQSPSDFIKSIRLNYAVDLLKTKKYSVTEVSELCGFTSVAYFSTAFRKFFGKSPTEIVS